jgi:Glycosyl hydrolases family 31
VLDRFAEHDLPTTLIHFDGSPWSRWTREPQPGNECAWDLGAALPARLRALGIKVLLHWWGHCVRATDFDRPLPALGDLLAGYYLDDGAGTEVSGEARAWVDRHAPTTGTVVSKLYTNSWTPWDQKGFGPIPDDWNRQYGHTAYVNDLAHDWEAMAEGIRRVFDSSTILPAPFNEFLGFQGPPPTLEMYFRRLHFGALQVVMDNSPLENLDPWQPGWDPRLIVAYRYYHWLHLALVPYLHSYDRAAYETGAPIFRDPDRRAFTTRLGEEIFTAYVVGADVRTLRVTFPPGEWIDHWDPARSYLGPGAYDVPVGPVPPPPGSPLVTGREPIFFRRGAIVPLDVRRDYTGHGTRESEGSLTLLVYPGGKSSFRYFDAPAQRWVRFDAVAEGPGFRLKASRGVSQPLLVRLEGWPSPPESVSVCGRELHVDGAPAGGSNVARGASERDVNGATQNSWYHDAANRRLIVKLAPVR